MRATYVTDIPGAERAAQGQRAGLACVRPSVWSSASKTGIIKFELKKKYVTHITVSILDTSSQMFP